jgi:Tol biopolymer transport system component
MKKHFAAFGCMILVFLAGCQPASNAPISSPTALQKHIPTLLPTLTTTLTPTSLPLSTRIPRTSIPTPGFTQTSIHIPTPTQPVHIVTDSLAGLIYQSDSQLWIVGQHGQQFLIGAAGETRLDLKERLALKRVTDGLSWIDLSTQQETAIPGFTLDQTDCACLNDISLTPTRRSLYFVREGDLWIYSFASQHRSRLTNTPDWKEIADLTYGNDMLVFYSTPTNPDSSEGWLGYPTVMHLDGFGLSRLTKTPGYFDVSPYGEQVAFSDTEGIKVFSWAAGSMGLTRLSASGQDKPDEQSFLFPHWSPEKNLLAVWSIEKYGGVQGITISVFDLVAGTISMRNRYYLSWDPAPIPPQWSPDGSSVAFEVNYGSYGSGKLWVCIVRQTSYPLSDIAAKDDYNANYWAWSPDSQMIAFTHAASGKNSEIWLGDTQTSNISKSGLPTPAEALGWISLSSDEGG